MRIFIRIKQCYIHLFFVNLRANLLAYKKLGTTFYKPFCYIMWIKNIRIHTKKTRYI